MGIHEKLRDINQRWNIKEDSTPAEKFKKFKIRIKNIFSHIDSHLSYSAVNEFCNILGISAVWHSGYRGYYGTNVMDAINQENNPFQLYKIIEIIFVFNIQDSGSQDLRGVYFKNVMDALEFSDINVSITAKKNDVILYPSGEEILDKELVNKVLSFLSGPPENHFIDALKLYQKKNSVKSAESLRRSLEEFLRVKLGNKKGLNANIQELGTYLKGKSTNNDIRNNLVRILGYLDQFFNENSKHKDGLVNEAENEYLIYQVALLLRYISQT
jgi:hypothetical protein